LQEAASPVAQAMCQIQLPKLDARRCGCYRRNQGCHKECFVQLVQTGLLLICTERGWLQLNVAEVRHGLQSLVFHPSSELTECYNSLCST
jgi:hypothetical protein